MKTHNMCRTPTYESWTKMRKRCRDEKSTQYKWYGARGITYDPRWDKFEAFLEDMGTRPTGKTLDRIDNNKNYTKKQLQMVYNERAMFQSPFYYFDNCRHRNK